MAGNWHAGRAAEFTAIRFLQAKGYDTERISGSGRKFDIIAWNGERTLCIVIRTSRTRKTPSFQDLITRLTQLVLSRNIPGEIQFWLYQPSGWTHYRIFPGGIMPGDWRER